MIFLVVFLSVLVVCLCIALFVSVRQTLTLDEKFQELGVQVEASLDILDGCYNRFSIIAETPVFSDEPVVKQLMNDVAYSRHALLLIANNIVTFDEEDEEDRTLWQQEKSRSWKLRQKLH